VTKRLMESKLLNV